MNFNTKTIMLFINMSLYYVQTNLFAIYLLDGGLKKRVDVRQFVPVFWTLCWQDNTNIHDCGIYAIRHMEAFQGGNVKSWTPGFEKNKVTNPQSSYNL